VYQHHFTLKHLMWTFQHLPYSVRVVVLVFFAAWTALLFHELAHALMARALRIRIWGISLGRGPLLYSGTIGTCQVRIALLPLHGEVRLVDQDAVALGYRGIGSAKPAFEWLAGSSWRAPLITAAGSVGNLLAAKAVVAYWILMPRPMQPLLSLSVCCFVVNAVMFLNLMPIRGLDGWRMALQTAAWRRGGLVES
jgi:membrane-associated protease RseP (regulator of RpoE activity)